MVKKKKVVTVIGGGTGTYVVLSGLKPYDINLGVIVSMMDSGGSTGRLRDQLGVLPPGDLRQCLVALSEAPLLWRQLFLYRFASGDMQGHNFGNIFLSTLEKVATNYDQVIKHASFILKTKGEVIPVTFAKTNLCVQYNNGKIIKGEGKIDEDNYEKSRIKRAFLEPKASANPKAINRLKKSNYIIIAPGDLYTSIIPVLLVTGVKKIISRLPAKIIYVMNLMTKSGQTSNYSAQDHLYDLEKYLGRHIDVVVLNKEKIAPEILKWYSKNQEKAVKLDKAPKIKAQIIKANIIDNVITHQNKADKLTRSILRHHPKKLAQVLIKLIYGKTN
jgi:uncharacterized cofD-like protein